jgi:hypothetical protein
MIEIGAIMLGVVIVGVALYLVAEPYIFSAPRQPLERKVKDETLEQNKEDLFVTLGEIEFDYHMGKLSEADYQELQALYRPQAALLLRQGEKAPVLVKEEGRKNDRPKRQKDLAEIEREIEAEIAKEVRRLKQQSDFRQKD